MPDLQVGEYVLDGTLLISPVFKVKTLHNNYIEATTKLNSGSAVRIDKDFAEQMNNYLPYSEVCKRPGVDPAYILVDWSSRSFLHTTTNVLTNLSDITMDDFTYSPSRIGAFIIDIIRGISPVIQAGKMLTTLKNNSVSMVLEKVLNVSECALTEDRGKIRKLILTVVTETGLKYYDCENPPRVLMKAFREVR